MRGRLLWSGKLVWVGKVLLLWAAALLVGPMMHGLLGRLLYVLGLRVHPLPASAGHVFVDAAYLPRILVCGFIAGLVPADRWLVWSRAALGLFRHAPAPITEPEHDWRSPLLWGWVLPAAGFLLLFASFNTGAGHSVLAGDLPGRYSRVDFFFGPITRNSASPSLGRQLTERLFFTMPMCFLASYALGNLLWQAFSGRTPRDRTLSVPEG